MRGLGEFQQTQMKKGDPRIPEIFRHARAVLDNLEQIMLYPHRPTAAAVVEATVVGAPTKLESTHSPEKLAHTVKEVSQMLGVGRSGIWKSISLGELRAVKFGSRTLVLDTDLRSWIASWPVARGT